MIEQRLTMLRKIMGEKQIDLYLVPSSDFHESEYVPEYFKAREFITGFDGSAGTAVITMTEAGLWTDGRYFVQAKEQLPDVVTLYKMGEEGVPSVEEYVENTLKEHGCLGFDGRVINSVWGEKLKGIVEKKHGRLKTDEDLIDSIWENRPMLSKEPVWILEEAYSGKSTAGKLLDLRKEMKEQNVSVHLLASLCDIAWLLNVRGGDIRYVPVVLSYLALTEDACIWFLQQEALNEKVQEYLKENNISVRPYEAFYDYIKTLKEQTVLLDKKMVSYRILNSIAGSNRITDAMNPTTLKKAVKNETEIANIRKSHIKDAVAMCRFMYWLKKNVGNIKMTELSVSAHLENLRKEQEGYLGKSFETISAYGKHGAVVHYAPSSSTDAVIEQKGFLLLDSGGHYLEGTTDITRTFALGILSDEMKKDYTLVCRANLNLAYTRFMYGCTGRNLDLAAREPLWEAGLDFKHGTGHGVGYLLNVHEGPNVFRWKTASEERYEAFFEEGMVTTDEPGLYKEGKYGIRLENELLCQKGEKNAYGQFMYFENLTYVPFDLDAIVKEQMTEMEIKRLNDYHAKVYEVISPYLNGDEQTWLKEATRAV